MMLKVIITLSTSLNLAISPMVWALAFGCGIGGKMFVCFNQLNTLFNTLFNISKGNGTLIASSANLVCIGVAEQHGYKFSFTKFFK